MQARQSPRSQGKSAGITAVAALLLFATAWGLPAAYGGQKGASEAAAAKMWASLQDAKPVVRGSLRLAACAGPGIPCRDYLVEALAYRWDGIRPNELKVTDLDHHAVVLLDRDVGGFLYMLPLNFERTLLATVWASADSNGGVKVYLLQGDRVRVVLDNGSRFDPQFIAANEATPVPIVLLNRYTGGIGKIIPQETEIWGWDAVKGRFDLRATVPVNRRFEAVAKLEHQGRSK